MLFFFSLRLKLLFEQFVFDMNNICEKFGLHASGAMTFDQRDISPIGYWSSLAGEHKRDISTVINAKCDSAKW